MQFISISALTYGFSDVRIPELLENQGICLASISSRTITIAYRFTHNQAFGAIEYSIFNDPARAGEISYDIMRKAFPIYAQLFEECIIPLISYVEHMPIHFINGKMVQNQFPLNAEALKEHISDAVERIKANVKRLHSRIFELFRPVMLKTPIAEIPEDVRFPLAIIIMRIQRAPIPGVDISADRIADIPLKFEPIAHSPATLHVQRLITEYLEISLRNDVWYKRCYETLLTCTDLFTFYA